MLHLVLWHVADAEHNRRPAGADVDDGARWLQPCFRGGNTLHQAQGHDHYHVIIRNADEVEL